MGDMKQKSLFAVISIFLILTGTSAAFAAIDGKMDAPAQCFILPQPDTRGFLQLAPLMNLLPRHKENFQKPMISIVIDDMGVDYRRSAKILELPAGVSTAFLPYSDRLQEQVHRAQEKGHELILHLPMQPDSDIADPGPDYLGTTMTPEELRVRLAKNLDAFQGYVAVNNHMGSKFTQDSAGLAVVMNELKARRIMFLDSMTARGSKAFSAAGEYGLPAVQRDIFIDNDPHEKSVARYLRQVEEVARRRGSVIAIGHPKDATIAALKKWLPTLEEKGFELVPLSRVMASRQPQQMANFGDRTAALP